MGPVLPHLAGVVWQVADCEGKNDDYKHPYDATPCSQYFLRGRRVVWFCNQRWSTSRRRYAAEDSGTTAPTRTANSVNCDLTPWQWTLLEPYLQWRSVTSGTKYNNKLLKSLFVQELWSVSLLENKNLDFSFHILKSVLVFIKQGKTHRISILGSELVWVMKLEVNEVK